MPSGEILDMVCNFDPTIRLEISREVWEIFQARHLGMEHSREIYPSRLAYVSSQVEPVGCGDRQFLMHRGQSKG